MSNIKNLLSHCHKSKENINEITGSHPFAVPIAILIRISHVNGLIGPTSPCNHCSKLPLSTYSYTSILYGERVGTVIFLFQRVTQQHIFLIGNNNKASGQAKSTFEHHQHSIQLNPVLHMHYCSNGLNAPHLQISRRKLKFSLFTVQNETEPAQ